LSTDPRLAAFCSSEGPEVFSGTVYGSQIWTRDPFDVDTIHLEARQAFHALLNRASSTDERPVTGKTLLLLGEAGAGKTHLLRAFRTLSHTHGYGYCGYLQMTSRSDNYARYILANLIDSLEHPYQPGAAVTGLRRLARGLLDAIVDVPASERERLVEESLEREELMALVDRCVDVAAGYARFADIDIDLLRAMLYVLPNHGRIHALALKWLRCEDLSRYDRDLLGDLVPRTSPEMPLRQIVALGKLVSAVHSAALVLLVDQIEEMVELSGEDGALFRSAINTLLDVADGLPNAVVVIACLEDLFVGARHQLPRPKLDRLEHDPEPVRISSRRTDEQVIDLVARRLEVLWAERGLEPIAQQPVFPFTAANLATLSGFRTRDLLLWCQQHRTRCIVAGRWLDPTGPEEQPPEPQPPKSLALTQQWNDFLASWRLGELTEEKMAGLLGWATGEVGEELGVRELFAQHDGRFVEVRLDGRPDRLLALCEHDPRGGGLARQLEEAAARAKEQPAIFLRTTDFPKGPRTQVGKLLTSLCKPKGPHHKLVVQNADWRALEALRAFSEQHHGEPQYADWRAAERPLSQLPSLRAALELERFEGERKKAREAAPPSALGPTLTPATPLRLGTTRGTDEVLIDPSSLTRHTAFLGGSGSGKTTAALDLVEGLLLRGIPVVMLDRKGDLARYADPQAWKEPAGDPERTQQRRKLQESIDVRLYTPGSTDGCPLLIPVAPDLRDATESEREQLANWAATSLGQVLGNKPQSASHEPRFAILQKAIEVSGRSTSEARGTVQALLQLIEERDEELLVETGGLDDKHFKVLVEQLQALLMRKRRLLEDGEPIDLDGMLRAGRRTPLTILCTQFLGDEPSVEFWVAQLLTLIMRWCSRNPAGRLQAVLLLDEADRYLPASRQPATKAPMENLLKRARSAGLGLMLATQSPGDLDYKSRDQVLTWVIGRIKEKVALGKVRPMLEPSRLPYESKLPAMKQGEFFLVRESGVLIVQADLNLLPPQQLSEEQILDLAQAQAITEEVRPERS
jgi:hypothetical protein